MNNNNNKPTHNLYTSTLEKKPENEELRMYAKIMEDKKHPFNRVPKEPKLDLETIFIKSNKKKSDKKCPKGKKICDCKKKK